MEVLDLAPGGRGNGGSAQGGGSASSSGAQRGAPPVGQYGMLHVIGGNDRGKQYELSRVTTHIGRGADQELVLADIAVSRRHIKIHLVQNGYRLQDLGSGNGTLVNGKRVDDVQLFDGDQVELGNTLIRFEHPPSRPVPEAGPPMPAMPVASGNYPPAYAPPPPPPYAPPPMASAGYQPMPPPSPYVSAAAPAMPQPYASSAAPAMPQSFASSAVAPVMPGPYGSAMAPAVSPQMQMMGGMPEPMLSEKQGGGFLATQKSRIVAFPALGGLFLLGLILLIVQVTRPAPQSDVNAALEAYNAGTKHFIANDYEAAKGAFETALKLAPDSPELKKYVEACSTETQALGHIKTGKKAVEERRYGDALQAFEKVEQNSVQFEDARTQAQEARREAANTTLTEAQDLSLRDPQAALKKIAEGLEYDKENASLLALKTKVEGGNTVPKRVVDEPVVKVPKQPKQPKLPHTRVAVERQPKQPEQPRQPVVTPTVSGGGGGDLQSQKGALLAYRSQNFANAISIMQNVANTSKGPVQAKAQSTIRDLQQVKGLVDKGLKAEGANANAAVNAYTEASNIDKRLSGGALSGYLNGKISALSRGGGKPVAQPGGKPVAQPGGARDPQKDAQADALLRQASSLASKDPIQARTLCRKAMQLYGKNTTDPKFQQAFKQLNSIKGKDDDED